MTVVSHLVRQLPAGASFSNNQLIPQLLRARTGQETQIYTALRAQPRLKVSQKALKMKAVAARRKSHSDLRWCWELYFKKGKGAGVEGKVPDHTATKRNTQQAVTSA